MSTDHRGERDRKLRTWTAGRLHALGLGVGSDLDLIVGDASFRRFWRVEAAGQSFMVMDAPPTSENNAQFVRLSRLFAGAGIAVPEVLAADLDEGFLLVSDLGQSLYGDVYRTAEHDRALEAALDTLLRLQLIQNPTGVIPPYTSIRFQDEVELFRIWFVRGLLSIDIDAPTARRFDETTQHLIHNVVQQPRVCVHRDFHSRNLLWQADGVTGVVDFQDALWGPTTYDLASLLRDCYVRLSEEEIARWRTRWLELAQPDGAVHDAAQFDRWLDLTAVQRQLKAVGIFARLMLRDGRGTHLGYIVPVLDHLIDVSCKYRELDFLGQWLSTTLRPAAVSNIAARLEPHT